MNIGEILQKSFLSLKKTSKTPRLDAEILLSHVVQKPREFILAHPEFELSKKQIEKFKSLLKRRTKHEPIAYILKEKEFYGLNFKVTSDTLIPRPETEMLVEKVLDLVHTEVRTDVSMNVLTSVPTTKNKKQKSKTAIIDVGTGSGNIIISIAKKIDSSCHSRVGRNPVAKSKVSVLHSRFRENDYIFFGIDFSKKALAVAKQNTKKNKVSEKIKFIHSDLLNCFLKNKKNILENKNLIIVANLPYVSGKIYSNVSPDIKKYEPKSALYSAKKGLAHYEKLFRQIKILEARNYKLKAILEFSPEQKTILQKLIKKNFPKSKIIFHKDLTKKNRIAYFKI